MFFNLKKGHVIKVLCFAVLMLGFWFLKAPIAEAATCTVTVTNPTVFNKEYVRSGHQFSVTFTSNCPGSGTYNISLDTGSTMQPVGSGIYSYGGGTVQATVPVSDSEQLYGVDVIVSTSDYGENDSLNSLRVDNTAPTTPTVIYPSATGIFVNPTSGLNITWAISTDQYFGILPISVKYSLTGTFATDTVTIGNYSANTTSMYWNPPNVTNTTTRVAVVATDLAGNNSYDYSDNPFTIDNQAPKTIAGSIPGTISVPTAPGASADDNISTTSDEVFAWSVISTPAGGTLSFSATNVLNPTLAGDVTGSYTARLTATDQAGNSASNDITFSWDGDPGQPIIISPTGGEYFKGGATTTIAWSGPSDTDLDHFKIEYSPDNGVTWSTLANSIASTTHSYVWTVPTDNTATALIRVTVYDIYNNSNSVSSSNFTVDSSAPTGLVLSSPTNPGLNFKGGSSYNITWIVPTDNFGLATNPIKLELSLDGLFNDTVLIANNLPNTGTYAWTATTTQSTTAKIRVTATDLVGNSASSSSANPFVLDSQPPIINISTPSLGTISTSTSAGVTVVDSYSGVASVLWTKVSGQGNIFFTPSAATTTPGFSADLIGDYVAMITATDNVGQVSTSTVSFHWDSGLTAPTVISPVAGYYVKGNATSTITWTSGAIQNHYFISYSADNGSTWTTVNPNYPGPAGSIAWTFPGDNTNQALIRVVAYDTGGNAATSTGTAFTVDSILPAISISNPTGATVAKGGANLNLTWTASDTNLDANNIGLDYSLDNGSNWTHIATTTNASSPYAWAAVATDTLTAKIRVTAKDLAGNTTATITPSFIIDNSGPIITIASSSLGTISTSTPAGVNSVVDNYSGVASTIWTQVPGSPGTVIFSPSNATTSPSISAGLSGAYIVRLTATDNAGNISTQDLSFIWDGNPGQPTVIHPNSGDYIMGGATTTISWLIPGGPAIDYYNIEYSLDGTNWLAVGTTTANSIPWLAPTVNTTTAQVRVTAWASGNPTTATGTIFAIDSTSPTVSINTPASPLRGGDNYNVTWTASDNILLGPNASLDYRADSVSSWTHIATTSPTASPYTWALPGIDSTSTELRVIAWDMAGNSQTATSGIFVVDSHGPVITQASSSLGMISIPTAASVGPVYDNYSGLASLVWTQASGLGTITFSPTATTTNPLLSGTVSGYYTALITATDNVGNVSTSTVTFYWDGALGGFIVTAPTAGDYLPGNSTTTISWTTPTGGNLNYFSIDYSINGGGWTAALPNGASVASTSTSTLWSVPTADSTSTLVRVTAHTIGGGTQIATSSVFAIDSTDPTATITTPATPLRGGDNYNVTWTASDNIQLAPNAVLYYTSNSGSNWFPIATTSPTSSPYTWTATTTESTTTGFKIMVWDMAGHSHFAMTGIFTVDNNPPIITIASSSLGVISTPTQSHATSTDSYSGVASTVWTQTGGPGTIVFSPSATSSDPYLSAGLIGGYSALLTATDNVGHVSTSTVTFSWLGGTGAFSVTHPAAGDYLMDNYLTTISWTPPSGSNIDHYKVEATATGSPWTPVQDNIASTTTNIPWTTFIGLNSTTSAIRVTAYDTYSNPTVATGTNFAIDATPPTVSIITPGAPLIGGTNYNITWTAADNILLGPIVSLNYSIDNGVSWPTIGTTTSATSSYAWTVPNIDSTSTLIEITVWDMAGHPASATTSNFTLSSQGPIITIASSSLGTINTYTSAGVTVTDNYSGVASITWNEISGPLGGSVNYAPNNTTSSPAFAATLSSSAVPYVVQITATNNANISSTATVTFYWNGAPATPYLIHPVYGDYLAGATTTTISWTAAPDPNLDYFNIQYSLDGGVSWNPAGTTTSTSIPWLVPTADTSTAEVQVTAYSIYGDATTTIGTPFVIDSTNPTAPTILTPNALTTPLQGGSNFNITWTLSTDLNFGAAPLTLEYSADGLFDDSVTIATGTAADAAFNWTVPPVNTSTTSKVRITAMDLVGHTAVSTSSAFIIDSLPPTIIMASNLGTTSVPIHPAPTFSDNVDNDNQLTYSWSMDSAPLGGTLYFSAPFIDNPTLSGDVSGGYTALLTVTDRAGNQTSATTTFTWLGNPGQPTLIYPSGGEFLPAGTINIQWSIPTTPNLDHFDVDYSLDGGTTWQWIAQGLNAASSSIPWTIAAPGSTTTLVRVTAYDTSNNQTSAVSGLFTIDTTAPIISAGSLGAITTAAAPGASATDNIDGPSDLTYAWSTVSTPAGGNINFSAPNILNPLISGTGYGNYAALLTVTDRAGNISSSPLSFTWGTNPGSGSSSGGGGGISPSICTSVIYSAWGACNGNIQFRTIVSAAPSNCSPSSAQQLAISQSCSSEINDQSGATTTPITTVGTNAAGFDVDAAQIMESARKYQTKTDQALLNRLTGQILIQVESHGYAWYVNPANQRRYYLGSASNAFQIMRLLGLGISNKDLQKIPVALLPDSIKDITVQGDSLAVRLDKALGQNWQTTIKKMIADPRLVKQLSGKILIQVQTNGEAWYVEPKTQKRYYLGRPKEAYALMRMFGLGISNKDINKIPIATFTPAQLQKVNATLQPKTQTK